jgi:hypothetical protein
VSHQELPALSRHKKRGAKQGPLVVEKLDKSLPLTGHTPPSSLLLPGGPQVAEPGLLQLPIHIPDTQSMEYDSGEDRALGLSSEVDETYPIEGFNQSLASKRALGNLEAGSNEFATEDESTDAEEVGEAVKSLPERPRRIREPKVIWEPPTIDKIKPRRRHVKPQSSSNSITSKSTTTLKPVPKKLSNQSKKRATPNSSSSSQSEAAEENVEEIATPTKASKRRKKVQHLSSQPDPIPAKFLLKNRVLFDHKELYQKNEVKVIDEVTWSLIEGAGQSVVKEYCTEHSLLHYLVNRTVDISAPGAGARSKSTSIHSSKITNFAAWQEIENLIQYKFDEAGKRNTTVEVVAIYSQRAGGLIEVEKPKLTSTASTPPTTSNSNLTKKTYQEA